ncbi:hypothetical protein [Aerococcus urinaeequi]
MSIINVSNGKTQGKISRVHGSRNYVVSAPKVKYDDVERYYYTNIIQITKNYKNSKNYKRYISKTRQYGNRLSDTTLINILKAYQDTLMVNDKLNEQAYIKKITSNLERNLKRYKISPSTIQDILKYDPQYNPEIIKKDRFVKKQGTTMNIKKTKVTTETKSFLIDSSYIVQIINFSIKEFNEVEINQFIKTINSNKKILSDSLIRSIILGYKETLKGSTKKKVRKRLITNNLQANLLRKGVHPDLIKLILHLDSNYDNG